MSNRQLIFLCFLLLGSGCTSIFGWDIHAPGVLSEDFFKTVSPTHERIALYTPPTEINFQSQDRGGRTADPQTYHVGEAFVPMLLEAFQASFDEFIFMEIEPTKAVLKRYGIPHLAVVRIKDFKNRVTWGSHAVTLVTETVVLDSDLKILGRFEATGVSDAKKVFAKRGGPQVNLNAAVENNILATIQYLEDSIRKGTWVKSQT